jgi:hypothetical protein
MKIGRNRIPVVALLAASIIAVVWTGCGGKEDAPVSSPAQQGVLLDKSNPAVQAVMDVQDRHTVELMSKPEVVGTATGMLEDGTPVILVFTKTEISPSVLAKGTLIPQEIEGVPVVVQVTGELKAMKGGGGGVSHTAKQTAPIQLGTSGGWRYDLANGYCCGGTLGALIQKGGQQYVLSNYHVLWADIVSGGNGRVATAGDPVIQPGLIDVSCNANNAQDVATLSGAGSLPAANVDAGYAQVIPNMVRTDGSILEVGTISAATRTPAVGLLVKKSGRTTGLTRSSITGINGTVQITYENECAGGTSFTKTFTGQIIVANSRCAYQNGGDSGSLMVEDVTTNPRAVGLCFAGSSICSRSAIAIANPINDVLAWAGATMVGQ